MSYKFFFHIFESRKKVSYEQKIFITNNYHCQFTIRWLCTIYLIVPYKTPDIVFTENNISDHLFRYFLDFIIYGLLLDPLGWAVLSFLVLQFHKKNHNITQTIVYAVIQKETVKDLLFYWSIDFICLILSFNVFNNSIITVSSEFFVLILTPILSFYSLFLYLVKKNGLYLE